MRIILSAFAVQRRKYCAKFWKCGKFCLTEQLAEYQRVWTKKRSLCWTHLNFSDWFASSDDTWSTTNLSESHRADWTSVQTIAVASDLVLIFLKNRLIRYANILQRPIIIAFHRTTVLRLNKLFANFNCKLNHHRTVFICLAVIRIVKLLNSLANAAKSDYCR